MANPARATVLLDAGDIVAAATYHEWHARFRAQLTLVSDDQGCGCCVHLFDIEGSPEAIASLPAELLCESAWSKPEMYARFAALRHTNLNADLKRDAERAFQEHRYGDVVRLLTPAEGELSAVQRAKLLYARRHSSPGRH